MAFYKFKRRISFPTACANSFWYGKCPWTLQTSFRTTWKLWPRLSPICTSAEFQLGKYRSETLVTVVKGKPLKVVVRQRLDWPGHSQQVHTLPIDPQTPASSLCTIRDIDLHPFELKSIVENASLQGYIRGEYAARFHRGAKVRTHQQPMKTANTNITSE